MQYCAQTLQYYALSPLGFSLTLTLKILTQCLKQNYCSQIVLLLFPANCFFFEFLHLLYTAVPTTSQQLLQSMTISVTPSPLQILPTGGLLRWV